MVFKHTLHSLMLSILLIGGLFEPQAIRAGNEDTPSEQVSQSENSLQKKWRKKKKKWPNVPRT